MQNKFACLKDGPGWINTHNWVPFFMAGMGAQCKECGKTVTYAHYLQLGGTVVTKPYSGNIDGRIDKELAALKKGLPFYLKPVILWFKVKIFFIKKWLKWFPKLPQNTPMHHKPTWEDMEQAYKVRNEDYDKEVDELKEKGYKILP